MSVRKLEVHVNEFRPFSKLQLWHVAVIPTSISATQRTQERLQHFAVCSASASGCGRVFVVPTIGGANTTYSSMFKNGDSFYFPIIPVVERHATRSFRAQRHSAMTAVAARPAETPCVRGSLSRPNDPPNGPHGAAALRQRVMRMPLVSSALGSTTRRE